jgi:RecB family exonuclease
LLEERREESFGVEITAAHPLGATLPRGEPFVSILTEETGGGARPVAASSLDVIASCVFRGFASELLRPRQGREAHDVADSREVGHIVHAGLEEAFRATSSLWSARPRDRGEILRMGLAAADRVLARGELASDLARVAVDQARESVRAVLEWSIADLAWDFALAEQVFGEEGGWEPVVLEREGVRLAVRGRIDRVDLAHDSGGVRVIDYKTRERSAEAHTTAFGTTKFQLALYARAAEAGLARARGEGVYLATQRLSPGSLPRNHREKWAEAHEPVGEAGVPRFERRLLSLVTELRRGDVSVRPSSPGVCVHCDLDGICRKPRFAAGAPADDPLGGDEAR